MRIKMPKERKDQHFVSQFYLKNFAYHKNGKNKEDDEYYLWAYDKSKGNYFEPNIGGICQEKYLYETSKDDLRFETESSKYIKFNDIENYFCDREGVYSKTIRRIIRIIENPLNRDALVCNAYDKRILCEFVANFLVRNPWLFKRTEPAILNLIQENESLIETIKNNVKESGLEDVSPIINHAIKNIEFKTESSSNSVINIVQRYLSRINLYFLYCKNASFITSCFPVQYMLDADSKMEFITAAFIPIAPHIGIMFNKDYRKFRNRIIPIQESEVYDRNRYYLLDSSDRTRFILSRDKETLEKVICSGDTHDQL